MLHKKLGLDLTGVYVFRRNGREVCVWGETLKQAYEHAVKHLGGNPDRYRFDHYARRQVSH